MKTVIIIQNKVTLKTDLSTLKVSSAYQFILICSQPVQSKLDLCNLELFDRLHVSDDFSHQSLCALIKPYLAAQPLLLTTDEDCMLRVAKLRDEFDLDGPKEDVINLFIDKAAMKRQLERTDIRLPKYIKYNHQRFNQKKIYYLQEIVTCVGLPLIIKPIDMAGSKEVVLCHHLKDLLSWAENNYQQNIVYEIDEFIKGDIYHCDALVKQGKIIHADVSRCVLPIMQFLQGKPMGSTPLVDNDPLRERIIAFNTTVINHLPAPDGATHLELFHTEASELVFLEIAARPSGGHVIQVYQKATNVNYELGHLCLQIGLDVDLTPKQRGFAAWIYYPTRPGRVTALFSPKLQCQHTLKWLIKIGDVLQPCKSLFDIALMVEIFSQDHKLLALDYQYLASFEPFNVAELGR